ncbi:MAG: multicopper oxidase domain-containing protein [Desulfosarcinaceae bacterium]|nr:multicopper oxidase domain-containing protein [Desulfosarcinaceae bacterium]
MRLMKIGLVVLLGMLVVLSSATGSVAKVREYWIAAEVRDWSYAPSGKNLIFGENFLPHPWDCSEPPFDGNRGKCRLTIPKVRYIEYTEGFKEEVKQPNWLGVLGPIIRAEVGDEVVVHFENRTRGSLGFDYGIHPHGFRYDKASEGAVYFGVNNRKVKPGAGAQIGPGGSFTYHWFADEDSSPGSMDPSSLVWWYHSHVDEPFETNLGLLGPIVIVKKGWAKEVEWPKGSGLMRPVPKDVDREFVTCYFIFDEAGGEEAGLMHAINGYVFGNLRGLKMREGERVRWYTMGMGNEVDLHTAHWHGKVVEFGNKFFNTKTDVVELLPGSMKTVTMTADNAGEWIMHCHVADHIDAGMLTTFLIRKR